MRTCPWGGRTGKLLLTGLCWVQRLAAGEAPLFVPGQAKLTKIQYTRGPAVSPSPSPAALRLVSAVCTAAVAVVVGAIIADTYDNLLFIAALVLLAVVTETLDFEPAPNTRVSLTIAVIITAATLGHLTGVVLLALATAGADYLTHRKAPEKALFNFGTLLLSGAAYVGVMQVFSPDLSDWGASIGPALIATATAYAANSGLVAFAISLDRGDRAVSVWQQCFTWVLPYYLAMGAAGFSVAVAYERSGFEAILLLVVPFAIGWPILKVHTRHVSRRAAHAPA